MRPTSMLGNHIDTPMSLNWHDRYQARREPDHTLRHMTAADIPAAAALLHSVGWPHQERDWQRLLAWSPDGCFVIEEPEHRLTGVVSTTPYGTALAWIGMMAIAPDRQRRGLGGELMRAAIDHLIARGTERIMLDATEAGRSLYKKLGFRDVYKVERWEGRASTYLGPRARRLKPDDIDAVLRLDAALFGIERPHILTRMIDEFPDLAWADHDRGELAGFLLGHQLINTVHLGPWMSWNAASAERLLRVALEQLQGRHVTLNIPDSNGRSVIIASDHNLTRVRHCTRMIYRDAEPLKGQPLAELAVASLATG